MLDPVMEFLEILETQEFPNILKKFKGTKGTKGAKGTTKQFVQLLWQVYFDLERDWVLLHCLMIQMPEKKPIIWLLLTVQ